jgi:hypothetical protein
VPAGKLQITPIVRGDVSQSNAPIHDQALAEKIRQLQEDRGRHARAIAEIDEVLGRIQRALGVLGPASDMAAGTDASEGPRVRRRYQKLPQTGEESVLTFVREHGNPSTAEINDHWRGEGRPGVANPTVARLLKRGALRRENDPAVRGSRYRIGI